MCFLVRGNFKFLYKYCLGYQVTGILASWVSRVNEQQKRKPCVAQFLHSSSPVRKYAWGQHGDKAQKVAVYSASTHIIQAWAAQLPTWLSPHGLGKKWKMAKSLGSCTHMADTEDLVYGLAHPWSLKASGK